MCYYSTRTSGKIVEGRASDEGRTESKRLGVGGGDYTLWCVCCDRGREGEVKGSEQALRTFEIRDESAKEKLSLLLMEVKQREKMKEKEEKGSGNGVKGLSVLSFTTLEKK